MTWVNAILVLGLILYLTTPLERGKHKRRLFREPPLGRENPTSSHEPQEHSGGSPSRPDSASPLPPRDGSLIATGRCQPHDARPVAPTTRKRVVL